MIALSATAPDSLATRSWRVILRYTLSTGGPLTISAAHFLASLLILHALPSKDFGIFSFMLIVVPLCLSASGALLVASLTRATTSISDSGSSELDAHLKANLLFSAFVTLLSSVFAYGSGAGMGVAILLGLYGGAMCLRWFARAVAYIANEPARVAVSDICYSLSFVGSLGFLWILGDLTITHVALMMVAGAVFGIACFGSDYLKRQFLSSLGAPLQSYLATWRDLTRWSLLGVLLTEATANAHAYLVIFVSGAQSFALLAIGALFMRPVSLSLSALSDVERPFMARSIAGGNMAKAERCMREFRAASVAIWIGTTFLCLAILTWFPALVLKQNYRPSDVATVVALWSAIMVMRLLRTPASVLLQAAGEFRALARAAYLSSATSISLTLALLLMFGPIFSLIGILVGDAAMTVQILRTAHICKRAHG